MKIHEFSVQVQCPLQHLSWYFISHKTYLLGKCDFLICSIVIFPSCSCCVTKFCLFYFFLPVILSAEMFVNLWAKVERKFYCNIPLCTIIPSYCSHWCETYLVTFVTYFVVKHIFVTFPKVATGRWSRKSFILKNARKIPADVRMQWLFKVFPVFKENG